MSDFLASLAARTLAQSSLQPRVLSRFEPERGGEPVLPAEETEYARAAPAPAVRIAPRSRQEPSIDAPRLEPVQPDRVFAPPEVATPRTTATLERSEAVPAPSPQPIEAVARQESAVEKTPAAPRREAAPPPRPAPRKSSREPQPPRIETITRVEGPARTESIVDVREHTKLVEVPVVRRETVIETEVVEDRRSSPRAPAGTPRPHDRTIVQREVCSRYEEVPPVIVEPPRESVAPLASDEHLTRTTTTTRRLREIRGGSGEPESPAPPAPPEIHISIGRVEVRATTAPATEKRRREAPRMMTIDDYVAQRARKERP